MKIGIDCRLWSETGVGRYTRNLVEQLLIIDKKNNYFLFILSKDEENIKFAIRNSQFAIRLADVKWHTLEEQLKFPKIINKENLDLMHFPYHSVPVFYNKPFVLTVHDLIPYNFPTGKASTLPFFLYWLKFLAYKHVLKNAAKKALKIIAVSNATKDEIIDHLHVDSAKVPVIYEGVSVFGSKGTLTKRYTLDAKRYFLYVGNAFPHKNLERLLEAFQDLKSQISNLKSTTQNLKLILVGREDYFYKRLKRKVGEMKLSGKVIFLQNVSDEELSNLYQNAIALILPSFMEGFGLPALEAMANNCLVLASDIPALREVCDDAATYFDPCSVKDISEKMKGVCSNDSNHRSEKINKGFERAKLFSWQKMAEKTLAVYENVT